MDNNTKDVLMALIPAVVVPIVGVIVVIVNQNNLKNKVDGYHKEVNGKMGLLLETTKQLATEKEKAREKGDDKKEPGL